MSNRLKCKSIFISTLIDKTYQYLVLIDNIYDTLVYAILSQRQEPTTARTKSPPSNEQPQLEKRTPNQSKIPQPVKYNQ